MPRFLVPVLAIFAALALQAHALGGVSSSSAAAMEQGAQVLASHPDDVMRLHIVRHSQTHANIAGLSQGVKENAHWTTLTQKGLEDARRVGHHLSSQGTFKTIYHSPMVRARQTAQEIQKVLHGYGQRPVLVEIPEIQTLGRGAAEGRPLEELEQEYLAGKRFEGQESHADHDRRLHRGLHRIITSSKGQKNVAIVGHYHTVAHSLNAFAAGGAAKPNYIPSHFREEDLKKRVWITGTAHSLVSLKPSSVGKRLDSQGRLVFDPQTTRIDKWGEDIRPDGSLAHPEIKQHAWAM